MAAVKVVMVSSEVAPFAKTGGLGDVVGALPKYLRKLGHDVRVFMPLYSAIDTSKGTYAAVGSPINLRLGQSHYTLRLFTVDTHPGMYFVHCPELYHRASLYTNDPDEHRRFLALCWGALHACQATGFAPDVVHCNDWQTGLLPLTLKTAFAWDRLFANTKTLMTIHNLNYQGAFPAATLPDTNLEHNSQLFHQDQLQAGRINYLLHGLLYAGAISTVSPTYAREIQTPEHGAHLDGFLRARHRTVYGILNGVDYDEWSPNTDKHLVAKYSPADLSGKERCKKALLESLGLPYIEGVPVVGIVSRLASQKGFDLLADVLPDLLRRHGFQLVVLGSGEPRLQEMFSHMQHAFPKQVCFYRGFSNPLAHMIEAGSDMFLMPSRYEPCGLNQMYSLRYGTPPIVHRTGGLADTVRPWHSQARTGTGFVFDHHTSVGARWALESALAAYRDKAGWRQLMLNGMAEDFSWESQARLYETLYSRLEG